MMCETSNPHPTPPRRYGVPRVAFVNKLDREGANPWKVVGDLRKHLRLNAAAVQVGVGRQAGRHEAHAFCVVFLGGGV